MNEDARPVRAFLAVEIAADIHARLVALKDEFATTRADVRWVRDSGLHATVRFLGPVQPRILDQMRQSLAAALNSRPAIPVRVAGLGVFPSWKRARVIWVGLHGDELPKFAAQVEEVVEQSGFAPEPRPFQGHLTLGRVRGPRSWGRLEAALKAHWQDEFGTCEIRELVAFRSDLRPDGSVYTKLWTIPLS